MTNEQVVHKIVSNQKPIKIIVDGSAQFYRCAYAFQGELLKSGYKDWGIFKYMVLKGILDFKKKFMESNDIEVIIALDRKTNNKYWRTDLFSNYKASRSTAISKIPKEILFNEFKNMENDLREVLPWRVVEVPNTEADDVIACIAMEYANENIVIYGTDKDYQQLQTNHNVYQYCPMKKIFVECEDPILFKFEHVFRGDVSDNIPNILSSKNVFQTPGERQTPLKSTRIKELFYTFQKYNWAGVKAELTPEQQTRLDENISLIDFDKIPDSIRINIIESYKNTPIKGTKGGFWKWAIASNQVILAENYVSLL